jgi:YD repeat-containing protein
MAADTSTYNASGLLTSFTETGKTIQNVTYTNIGFKINQRVVSGYQEIIDGVTKTVTLTYNDNATIKTITVV